MSTTVSVILEIIKITVPALIVFATVYYLMKEYFGSQLRMKSMDYKQKATSTTVPLKLQAYERLSLFCERIDLPSVTLRVRENGMTASDLRMSMMIAIQHEFEHNITQQVYVSQNLWEIIKIARDNSLNILDTIYESTDPKADGAEFAKAILAYHQQQGNPILPRALQAIKEEAGILL